MTKPLRLFFEEEKDEEEAAAAQTSPPAPANSPRSSDIGSPRSDPSMKLSSSSTRLSKLKEIAENKRAEEDAHSSKTEGQTSAGESSNSGEGSGLAEKASLSPAKVKKSVTLQRISDEAPDSVLNQTTSLLSSAKSVPPSEFHAIMMKSSNESSKAMVEEAWERLKTAFVYFGGKPVGSLAAMDPTAEDLNYNQVFVRDFVPTGLACRMKNPAEQEIVRNFLLRKYFVICDYVFCT